MSENQGRMMIMKKTMKSANNKLFNVLKDVANGIQSYSKLLIIDTFLIV